MIGRSFWPIWYWDESLHVGVRQEHLLGNLILNLQTSIDFKHEQIDYNRKSTPIDPLEMDYQLIIHMKLNHLFFFGQRNKDTTLSGAEAVESLMNECFKHIHVTGISNSGYIVKILLDLTIY